MIKIFLVRFSIDLYIPLSKITGHKICCNTKFLHDARGSVVQLNFDKLKYLKCSTHYETKHRLFFTNVPNMAYKHCQISQMTFRKTCNIFLHALFNNNN